MSSVKFNNKELNLIREWFDAVQDSNKTYLQSKDWTLYLKIKEQLKLTTKKVEASMLVEQLIEKLKAMPQEDVVICQDESGGWDNIKEVHSNGSTVNIVFGGGSPFSDE